MGCEEGNKVGYDPTLISIDKLEALSKLLEPKHVTLVPVRTNLVDELWGDEKPSPSLEPPFVHEVKYAGEPTMSKLGRINEKMGSNKYLIVTNLDEIAWMLNMRGDDIDYNPLFYSFLILNFAEKKGTLYMKKEKFSKEIVEYLNGLKIA